jgi:hypothetical protein
MGLRRVVPIVVALWAGSAAAQTLPWPDQAAPSPEAPSAPSGSQQTLCTLEITRMTQEVENLQSAARNASERKAKRDEVCRYLVAMARSATRLMQFATENSSACGFSTNLMTQIRDGSTRAVGACRQVCILEPASGRLDDVPPQFANPMQLANSDCGSR